MEGPRPDKFQFVVYVPGRVWGGTAFAKRSEAMKAPVGLLSGSAVLRQQDGGALPRQVPARCTRALAGVWGRTPEEVKLSRMGRTFSRIENLRPRDGSCPHAFGKRSFYGYRGQPNVPFCCGTARPAQRCLQTVRTSIILPPPKRSVILCWTAVALHEYQLKKAHEQGLKRSEVPPFLGLKRSDRSNDMPA